MKLEARIDNQLSQNGQSLGLERWDVVCGMVGDDSLQA
jgi:hypothetical protein